MTIKKLAISVILITFAVNILMFTGIYYLTTSGFINFVSTSTKWKTLQLKINPEVKKTIVTKEIEEKITIKNLQSEIINAIKKLSPSVVSIVISKNLKIFIENPFDFFWWHIAEKKEKIGWWSGIIVTKDGYILTNKHVVQDPNADYTVVTSDGKILNVERIWIDPVLDLAILKVNNRNWKPVWDLKPAEIKPLSEKVEVWQFVIAIWNALAQYSNTATFGIISALGRNLNDLDNETNSVYIGLYQTDAAINPWNSGGPLADINGRVIGINTAISAIWQWIWFSLPISKEFVNATLKSIEKYGKIIRPFLWIEFVDLNPSIAKTKWLTQPYWALIKKVLPNTPASKAWLKKGDIILKINNIDITLDHPLLYVLYTYLPWDKIELLIERNWELIKKEVVLSKLQF